MRETLTKLSVDPDYLLLCARVDGEPVGAATGVVCHGLHGGADRYLVVEDVIVDAQYRHRGIASALLRELERFAGERSCSQIVLVTEDSRSDAVGFYAAVGFSAGAGFKKRL